MRRIVKKLCVCGIKKNKSRGLKLDFYHRAERTRFELVVGLLLRQFSKLVVSATHPPLHYVYLDDAVTTAFRFGDAKLGIIFKTTNYFSIFLYFFNVRIFINLSFLLYFSIFMV